jgi:hypothetical protein
MGWVFVRIDQKGTIGMAIQGGYPLRDSGGLLRRRTICPHAHRDPQLRINPSTMLYTHSYITFFFNHIELFFVRIPRQNLVENQEIAN